MTEPSVDAAVEHLRESHQVSRIRLRNLVQIGRLLNVAMLVVSLLFLASFYSKVTTMYTPERFEEPLQTEAQHLLPKLEPELRALWTETSAVYGDMAKDKLEKSLPQVLEASEEEFQLLVESLKLHAEQRMGHSLDRIGDKHGRRLREEFPGLADEDEAERMVIEWMEAIESDFGMILATLEIRYSEDLGALQATVEQFHNEELEALDEEELTRQFVHLWLMKVDRWVMLGDEGLALGDVKIETEDDGEGEDHEG